MNTVKEILDVLESDLKNITIENGFQSNVIDVIQKLESIDKITDTIKINLITGIDILKEETESFDIREVDIMIIIHCKDTGEDYLVIDDIINQLNSNSTSFNTSLSTISNLLKVTIKEKNYSFDYHSSKKTVGILLKIEYSDITNIDS